MPDEHGLTRRERNENFDADTGPPVIISESYRYLWNWYYSISDRIRRVKDGICEPIPPSEFVAWSSLISDIVRPFEYAILWAMDDAFCKEMNKELADFRLREDERIKESRPHG